MKVTVGQVKEALRVSESYDIVNMIRNSSGDNFKAYVPLANAENIADVGAGIQINQTIQNDFITALVDRIGLVVMRSVSLQNPLKKFKKGTMAMGQTIEEIFTDLTKEKLYDPEEAEEKVFQREIPNVHTLFHQRNRQGFYHQTIQDDSLKTAFTSWGNFDQFLSSIINAIYNSAEVDEYKYMKLLIDNYASKGQFTAIKVPEVVGEASARELVKVIRATATKMTLPFGSRDYNALAVHTRSDMSNLHLFITADLQAELDVDVLASAFNMDKTNFVGNITVIDKFATPGLEAVMVDADWFMVYDNNLKMETIRNPRGLYWNYYYHVWQTLSASRFSNAVAFYSSDLAPVTQVILSPALTTLKQGRDLKYETYVRQNDDVERPVAYTVEGFNGATLSAGTTISNEGVLTVASDQTGELKVKATVTYTTGEGETATNHDVTGEALVVVTPTVQ